MTGKPTPALLPQGTMDDLTPEDVFRAVDHLKEYGKWILGVEYDQHIWPTSCGAAYCILGGAFLLKGLQPPNDDDIKIFTWGGQSKIHKHIAQGLICFTSKMAIDFIEQARELA